jgi:hypothetical protein
MQQKPEPGDEPLEGGFWLSWRLAVEQVERSHGVWMMLAPRESLDAGQPWGMGAQFGSKNGQEANPRTHA